MENGELGGLSPLDLFVDEFSRVTNNMRRVARFDDAYCFQNKDEYYAETWTRFSSRSEESYIVPLSRPKPWPFAVEISGSTD
jgi:hypothetical protein